MTRPATSPLISVIAPVFGRWGTLERAVGSVMNQTFSDWELLLIDDGSTDDSSAILRTFSQQDARIRSLQAPENCGPSVAWNLGLLHARGEYVCYLDSDDEFYPDYFAAIERWKGHGDVLFFRYDLVDESDPEGSIRTWQPDQRFPDFFSYNVSLPLGVAHHKKWFEKIGGFHELAWDGAEWDFWKRLVRAGAETLFIPSKSGIHHIRADANHQAARLAPRQQKALEANWNANKPLFGDAIGPFPRCKINKIAFVSPHCVLDFTNGAAVATYAGLKTLAENGFSCKIFCGSRMDSQEEKNAEEVFARQGILFDTTERSSGHRRATFLRAQSDGIIATVFRNASTRGEWQDEAETAALLSCCEEFLKEAEPDAVWTYDGDPVALAIQRLARRCDIPILFALHNF